MRNSFVFKKRPNSLIKTWTGVKVSKAVKQNLKSNKPLFKKK